MTVKQTDQAPPALSDQAREVWDSVTTNYELEPHDLALLASACRQITRADECRQRIEQDGLTVSDRWGQAKEHPLLAAERQAQNAARLAVRELSLDIDRPSDPPRLPRGPRYDTKD